MTTTTLTNNFGAPVPDNEHTLTAGERGPVLLQDHFLIETLAHFDRERIPERVVQRRGRVRVLRMLRRHVRPYSRASLRRRRPAHARPGPILDGRRGERVGRHRPRPAYHLKTEAGIANHTGRVEGLRADHATGTPASRAFTHLNVWLPSYDPFDITKVWRGVPRSEKRNPTNAFAGGVQPVDVDPRHTQPHRLGPNYALRPGSGSAPKAYGASTPTGARSISSKRASSTRC